MRFIQTLPMLTLVAAAGAAPAAQGELVTLEWSTDGSFERAASIASGHFVEACGKLPANLAVQWHFESGSPLDFNVHFHEGKQVRYPERRGGIAKAAGTLITPADQDYCWMWTNKSASEVMLKFSLRRP